MRAEEIRRRFPRIVMNLIIVLILWIIVAFVPQTIRNIVIPGLNVNADWLMWIVGIVFMAIFLVRALADALALADILTDAFIRKLGATEEKSPKRAVRDFIYIIAIVLVATALSPILAAIKDVGSLLVTATTYVALALIIILIYDIGRILYRIVEQKAESIADRLAQAVEKKNEKR